MTDSELASMFPVGTRFYSAITGKKFTVSGTVFKHTGKNITVETLERSLNGEFIGCVRNSDGVFAEIIEKPIPHFEVY